MSDAFVVREASRKLARIAARIFPQDPLVAARNPRLGVLEVKLREEACLGVGPTSSRVAVVDYNGDLDQVLEPAGLLANGNGFKVGRGRPADNHHFRQVNVWAVITRTLDLLEDPLVFGQFGVAHVA